ncbi:MAG: hypothetical protein DRQ37_06710 [Gammaproteobacteria bacterium]|nr:MAG: hypothetical protein DRQ37_06710 [Gammaproteobacteria bacterium]
MLSQASSDPTDIFYGVYEGTAGATKSSGLSKPELKVVIRPRDKGFAVEWATVTKKADGRTKRKNYAINFETTRRPNIYGSGMRRNMFGKAVPLDPLKGDPYVWAKIAGKTLTVYAMLVNDDGGYEMQVYERTRTESGLDLKFTRVSDGQPVRVFHGKLTKVADPR